MFSIAPCNNIYYPKNYKSDFNPLIKLRYHYFFPGNHTCYVLTSILNKFSYLCISSSLHFWSKIVFLYFLSYPSKQFNSNSLSNPSKVKRGSSKKNETILVGIVLSMLLLTHIFYKPLIQVLLHCGK